LVSRQLVAPGTAYSAGGCRLVKSSRNTKREKAPWRWQPTSLKQTLENIGFWPFSAISGRNSFFGQATDKRSKATICLAARRYAATAPVQSLAAYQERSRFCALRVPDGLMAPYTLKD
jgi:hypothetical protein